MTLDVLRNGGWPVARSVFRSVFMERRDGREEDEDEDEDGHRTFCSRRRRRARLLVLAGPRNRFFVGFSRHQQAFEDTIWFFPDARWDD
ncbi:hypothetical protein V3C99_003386 [Haemonchus contortus]